MSNENNLYFWQYFFAGDCPSVNLTASFGCDLSDGAALDIRWLWDTCLNRCAGNRCSGAAGADTFAAPIASSFVGTVRRPVNDRVSRGPGRPRGTSPGIFTGDLRSTSAAVADTPSGATAAAEFCGGRPTA